MLDFQAARWLLKKEVPRQAGNNHPTSIPTGVFKTSDGYVNVATTGQKIWERFCIAAGANSLLEREEYKNAAARSKNRDALNAEIDILMAQRSSAEWVERLNAAGVPCGPIYDIDEVFADPQVEHLGIASSVQEHDGRTTTVVGQPFTLSRTPSTIASPPPKLGEHNDDVLQEFGYSAEDIAALRESKAI